MKNIFVVGLLSLAFIIQPSFALAAPLTNEQATSLIGVVQSSPATPASAFVNLITVFSNITNVQAESLIGVVQASPGTPANAFVNLLTSFTVDFVSTPATNSLDTLNQSITALNNKIDESNTKLGNIMDNTKPAPVVTPPAPVEITAQSIDLVEQFTNEPSKVYPFGNFSFNMKVMGTDGKQMKTPLSVVWPDDAEVIDAYTGGKGVTNETVETNPNGYNQFGPYIPTTPGKKTITFTSGSLTKTVTVEVK